MAEMVSGYECSNATITYEQKEKISKKVGLFSITLGLYFLLIVSLKYIFREINVGYLIVGGIFLGVLLTIIYKKK